MMNHMVRQVGPRIREGIDVSDFVSALPNRPQAPDALPEKLNVAGYPQKMQGMQMSADAMQKIMNKREARGMRHNWHIGVKGLMTVLRVLPEDLYWRVMHDNDPIEPGEIFDAIAASAIHPPERSPSMT